MEFYSRIGANKADIWRAVQARKDFRYSSPHCKFIPIAVSMGFLRHFWLKSRIDTAVAAISASIYRIQFIIERCVKID